MKTVIFLNENQWTEKSKLLVKHSTNLIADILSLYTNLSAEETFKFLFPNCHVWFSSTLQGHALAMWGNIRFLNNKIMSLSLVVHEFGHLLCVVLNNAPLKQLYVDEWDELLKTVWKGSHPKTLKGYKDSDGFANLFEIWILGLGDETELEIINNWFSKWLPIWLVERRTV